MSHVSIDLETLDTRSSAAILSIGAARFCPVSGEIISTFYERISHADKYGTSSASTIAWWKKQDPEVIREAFGGRTPAEEAANRFAIWLNEDDKVWGNGASFDVGIMETWVGQFNVPLPYKFWNIRDMRTLVDVAEIDPRTFPFEGDRHNALADAIHQAKIIAYGLEKLSVYKRY